MASAAIAVVSCTVDGQASAPEDLTAKSVSAADFPAGASRVPPPAVPGAMADITGRPLHGTLEPAGCTPKPVEDAVVWVGMDPGTQDATFSSAVAHAGSPLQQLTAQAARCTSYTSGAMPTASTRWTSTLGAAPSVPSGVTGATIERTGITGGISAGSVTVPMPNSMTTRTRTLLAQRDATRVYVEYRWHSAAPLPATQRQQLDTLFARAVAAAFG